jgi:hypothetical protein
LDFDAKAKIEQRLADLKCRLRDCSPTEIVATSTAMMFNSNENVIALAYATAEAAASVTTPAFSKDCPKDVGILAIVMTELKLRQVQRQIGLADVVIGADNSALQQTPEGFQIVRMDLAAHVFMRLVVYMLMRERLMELLIASGLIGREQADVWRYGLANETAHSLHRSILDDLTNHVAFCDL